MEGGWTTIVEIKLDNFIKIREDYKRLNETDPNGAYSLKTRAAAEKHYIDELAAEAKKEAKDLEAYAKHLPSALVKKFVGEMPVGKAEHFAKGDDDALQAWKDYNEAQYLYDLLVTHGDLLEKIYYDAKDVWDRGNRNYREGK